MKTSLIGILLAFTFQGIAQNNLDEDGLRHGDWKFTKTEFMVSQADVPDGFPILPPDTSFYEMVVLKGHYSHGVKNGMWFSKVGGIKAISSEINFVNDTIAGPLTVYKGIQQLFTGNAEKTSNSVRVKYSAKGNYQRISKQELLDNYSNLKLVK